MEKATSEKIILAASAIFDAIRAEGTTSAEVKGRMGGESFGYKLNGGVRLRVRSSSYDRENGETDSAVTIGIEGSPTPQDFGAVSATIEELCGIVNDAQRERAEKLGN